MLKKNVYLLYPAGYHGNYLKWAIEVSDLDSRDSTPLDPVNRTSSVKLGGVGTSHVNPRIPTHQSFRFHIEWVIRNRPEQPKIYLINSGEGKADNGSMATQVASLLAQDLSGIVIAIHDDNDPAVQGYGRINCVTKWPTYIPAMLYGRTIHDQFDPFHCQDDQVFRNFIVDNDFLGTAGPIDLDQLGSSIWRYNNWYQVRHGLQPHEVNTGTYPEEVSYQGRYFSINCSEIPNMKFLDFLEHLLYSTNVSDRYDTAHVKTIHPGYIDAQANLQWFDSFRSWQDTGKLDAYLTSHSVIEAEVIRNMLKSSLLNDVDWRSMSLVEINDLYQRQS